MLKTNLKSNKDKKSSLSSALGTFSKRQSVDIERELVKPQKAFQFIKRDKFTNKERPVVSSKSEKDNVILQPKILQEDSMSEMEVETIKSSPLRD